MIDILIPVYHRPQNVRRVLASILRTTTEDVNPLFIVEAGDKEELRELDQVRDEMIDAKLDGYLIVPDTCHTYAQKINYAFTRTGGHWIFLVGDDVIFRPLWLKELMKQAFLPPLGNAVFGTMDAMPGEEGESRVEAGQHATHMMISRGYVEVEGGSWDGPGIVCHEGYHHWYVDDEIVTHAKQLGYWGGVAKDSIVEHMHPLFGRGKEDLVYQEGRSYAKEDKALFRSRYEKYIGPREWSN